MLVKFENGYQAELKDKIAKIYIERGRVKKISAPVKAEKKSDKDEAK